MLRKLGYIINDVTKRTGLLKCIHMRFFVSFLNAYLHLKNILTTNFNKQFKG